MPRPHLVRINALQPRIDELLKQTSISQQKLPDETSAPAHPSASLLGLPGELRSYIYELAVFHEPSDGVIAPLSDDKFLKCMTLVSINPEPDAVDSYPQLADHWSTKCTPDMLCERFRVSNSMPMYGPSYASTRPVKELQAERAYNDYLFCTSANYVLHHFCTLDCLCQPPITKVNRQVREESLRAFYSVNHFHLEMHNFRIQTKVNSRRQRSVVDWWRGTGDTNLREIRHLSFVGHPLGAVPEAGVMIAYDKRQAAVSFVNKEEWPKDDEDAEEGEQLYRQLAAKDPEAVLHAYVELLKESGLHVRVLECMVAALEPVGDSYLRDRIALE
ncbi:hypothetical protein LTR85_010285 [Meristemomyces frigidus]|nr:hypothetical protein LTR85_010285 [Meristemomyces frigidus]